MSFSLRRLPDGRTDSCATCTPSGNEAAMPLMFSKAPSHSGTVALRCRRSPTIPLLDRQSPRHTQLACQLAKARDNNNRDRQGVAPRESPSCASGNTNVCLLESCYSCLESCSCSSPTPSIEGSGWAIRPGSCSFASSCWEKSTLISVRDDVWRLRCRSLCVRSESDVEDLLWRVR